MALHLVTSSSEAPATAALSLLALGDGRFPGGGHAHSAGAEAAVVDGRITGIGSLEAFLRGRLATSALVDAALAAATVAAVGAATGAAAQRATLRALDEEASARLPAAPLREASRRLGRGLLRAAARAWPHPVVALAVDEVPEGAHHAVALGAVGVAIGASALDVARVTVHHAVATPSQAALRLLGLDPVEVVALAVRLAPEAEAVARRADALAGDAPATLPSATATVVDIAATEHVRRELRLFAT